MLYAIIDENPDISLHTEDKLHIPACKYGECCYEVECKFSHFLNPDGRRMLRKIYNKRNKEIQREEKIQLENIQIKENIRIEIQKYRNGFRYDWNDLDDSP